MGSSPPIPSTIDLRNPSSPPAKRKYILYFITGNPGLIAYYTTFLTHLYALLSSSYAKENEIAIQVYGRSLSGFGVDDQKVEPGQKRLEIGKPPPYSLEEQIAFSQRALEELLLQEKSKSSIGGNEKDVRVILIGHSVGAYILLEIIRRVREKTKENIAAGVRIAGGVCLFPTVTHIAKSPSGRRATWALTLPAFALLASGLARLLTFWIPVKVFGFLVRKVMHFPPDAARTTAAFVKSKAGVRQALYMARDEMLTITTDEWDEEIWGAAKESEHQHPRAMLRFLFGTGDHWVADETRDELIKARGVCGDGVREEWRPKMEVDEVEGWPHGFCIKHSVPVAERVRGYVEDIIAADMKDL